jgi:glycogen debranching enzyme
VRKCLYLFAAATVNDKGFLPGYIYEYPKYVSGSWHLQDYALLFVVTACDYFNHTDDEKTFMDLYPVIKGQMDAMENTIDDEGVVTVPDGCEAFIDWCKGLEKITALHGVYMYTLKALSEVLNKLSHPDTEAYEKRYERVYKSSIEVLYDSKKNAFINKKDNFQFSVHSAVWMILGGAVEGEECAELIGSPFGSAFNYNAVRIDGIALASLEAVYGGGI